MLKESVRARRFVMQRIEKANGAEFKVMCWKDLPSTEKAVKDLIKERVIYCVSTRKVETHDAFTGAASPAIEYTLQRKES